MTNTVAAPTNRDDANGPFASRTLVVLGGVLSAPFLLPTMPYVWVIIGAILVPMVWVKTNKTRKAMMSAASCSTKAEWKAFVAALPTKKQLEQGKSGPQAYPAGSAMAAIAYSEGQRPAVRSHSVKQPRQAFSSLPRPELQFPHYRVLGPGRANYEVVGEAYREENVIAALGGLVPNVEKTVDEALTHLIPEPENPHGYGNAVMVWINGHHVGYLANEDAARFRPVLERIVAAGYLPTTTGRIWGVTRHDWDGKPKHHLYARVALHEPELLLPTNAPPTVPYSLMPWGPAIQVTKEADYLPELTEHLHGSDSFAIATIQAATRTLKNGSVREYATVHLDGDQVGELTPAMSEKILPTVRHLADLGFASAGWARVKGSALAIEVTLQVAKAHELPPEWLSEIPVTIPALHSPGGSPKSSQSTEATHDGIATRQQQREENWEF